MFILSSCSTPKLTNTIWNSATEVTNNGQIGTKVTLLYFQDNGSVNVYNSIVKDDKVVVPSYKCAEGKYQLTGSLKKNANLTIDGVDIERMPFAYNGLVNIKKNAMVLVGPDSLPVYFIKNNDVKFEN